MTNIDDLMFRREHFQIPVVENVGHDDKKFYGFGYIEIPPYHPSMAQNGIEFIGTSNLVVSVLEDTIKDLESVADKIPEINRYLQGLDRTPEGRVKIGRFNLKNKMGGLDISGIMIEPLPIVRRVFIGKYKINPYGYNGDQGITIHPKMSPPSFKVPKHVQFSPELMREYQMQDEDSMSELFDQFKRIRCPNGWYRHNLADINAIFYKNLVIALDNAIVKRKYVQQTEQVGEK